MFIQKRRILVQVMDGEERGKTNVAPPAAPFLSDLTPSTTAPGRGKRETEMDGGASCSTSPES